MRSISIAIFVIAIIWLGELLIFIGVDLEPGLGACKYNWFCDFLGVEDKKEAMQLLGWTIVFIASMCGLFIANRRAKAMEDAAQAQAKAAKAAESGNLQQRFKDAIEHLGSTSESVRISSAYTLFHMALEEESLRASIADILCTHIRIKTQSGEYKEIYQEGPSIEIQSLMELLFEEFTHSQEEQIRKFWKGLRANLSYGCFNGIILKNAQFRCAHLRGAQFLGAHFVDTQFQLTNLSRAQFHAACIQSACFRGTKLIGTKFWCAALENAEFQSAYLLDTQFQGARLESVQFQGGFCDDQELTIWDIWDFEKQINKRKKKIAELSKVVFAGGVNPEDIEEVIKILTHLEVLRSEHPEMVKNFEEEMSRHNGESDHTVPEGYNINVGAYTEEDARRWIAEYEKLCAINQTS